LGATGIVRRTRWGIGKQAKPRHDLMGVRKTTRGRLPQSNRPDKWKGRGWWGQKEASGFFLKHRPGSLVLGIDLPNNLGEGAEGEGKQVGVFKTEVFWEKIGGDKMALSLVRGGNLEKKGGGRGTIRKKKKTQKVSFISSKKTRMSKGQNKKTKQAKNFPGTPGGPLE